MAAALAAQPRTTSTLLRPPQHGFDAVLMLVELVLSRIPVQQSHSLSTPFCLQQHGFNAVLMLVELALSRIPVNFYMSGYMALWLSVFAAWSTLFYWRTGRCVRGGLGRGSVVVVWLGCELSKGYLALWALCLCCLVDAVLLEDGAVGLVG